MKTRTLEFVLGLIGGIVGIILSLLVVLGGGVIANLGLGVGEDALGGAIMLTGILAIVASVLGIVGSIVVRKKGLAGGIIMVIAAVGGFICLSTGYLIPAIILAVAGLLGIFRKVQAADNSVTK